MTDRYRLYIENWITNAAQLRKNVGYVAAHLIHKWHGPKEKRQYGSRWSILEKYQYDPFIDVRAGRSGVWEWAGNKIGLRDAVRRYFRARDEDATS